MLHTNHQDLAMEMVRARRQVGGGQERGREPGLLLPNREHQAARGRAGQRAGERQIFGKDQHGNQVKHQA